MQVRSHPLRRSLATAALAATVAAGLPGALTARAAEPGDMRTVAGPTVAATPGRIDAPRTAAISADGTIFFTDTENHMIRAVAPTGAVSNVAGTGKAGDAGDGGPALSAQLNTPHGVAVDNAGHVFIADSPNHRIRRVTLATGLIETVVGTGVGGYNGDGIPAPQARVNRPRFLLVRPDGSLIIADTDNRRVRRVDPSGVISTIAGDGRAQHAGDGGPATAASLEDPRGLAYDSSGNLYVSNAEGAARPAVRKVDAATGIISTVAGGSPPGFSGDGGPATAAKLNEPRSVAVAGSNLYIADSMNNRIRRVNLNTGIIDTVAGTGSAGFSGDGGPATSARLSQPRGIVLTAAGDVVVLDTGNHRLRQFSVTGGALPPPPPPSAPFPGRVIDPAGRLAPHAHVDVMKANGDIVTSLQSDEAGGFSVGLDDGSYRLVATALPACGPLQSPATTVSVSGGTAQPAAVDLHLVRGNAAVDTDRVTGTVAPDASGPAHATLVTPAGPVSLTFDELTTKGKVGASCRPEGDQAGDYDLLDTGVSVTGPDLRFTSVEVCLPYTEAALSAVAPAASETSLDLVTIGDGRAVTTSRDPDANRVCGRTTALVPVAVAVRARQAGEPIPPAPGGGYRLVASDGGIFSFGDASFRGSTGNIRLNQPIVGMAPTPTGAGYWLVASDGGIFSFGDATFRGSTGNIRLNQPIVGMAPTPTGAGYWLVASDGGIFSFGDARFHGSTGNIRLNQPIVGMAPTPTGAGYWLVASDGGIFSFGDATFRGSTGNIRLAKPITRLAVTPTGAGYWMVASDGGIFSFGDAAFAGSAAGKTAAPVVGLVASPSGRGYWLAAADGAVFAFGDAPALGSLAGTRLNRPIVTLAGTAS